MGLAWFGGNFACQSSVCTWDSGLERLHSSELNRIDAEKLALQYFRGKKSGSKGYQLRCV